MPTSEGFGNTLILPECAFAAEVSRDSIQRMMEQIDIQLDEQGAPEDAPTRIDVMMDNASALSTMVANGEIEHDEGVADIAYSAIYAFGKTIGFDQIVTLRGLTGTLLQNVLSINPCLGELEYQEESASLQRVMAETDRDVPWFIETKMPSILN